MKSAPQSYLGFLPKYSFSYWKRLTFSQRMWTTLF